MRLGIGLGSGYRGFAVLTLTLTLSLSLSPNLRGAVVQQVEVVVGDHDTLAREQAACRGNRVRARVRS